MLFKRQFRRTTAYVVLSCCKKNPHAKHRDHHTVVERHGKWNPGGLPWFSSVGTCIINATPTKPGTSVLCNSTTQSHPLVLMVKTE